MKISDYPTVSSERAIQHHVDMTIRRLADNPIAQAEAIAKHYTSHATLALNLLKIIENAKGCGCESCGCAAGTEQVIAFIVAQIKSGHQHDLGLFLEWPKLS